MPNKRYQPEEIIGKQQEKTVYAGFAFSRTTSSTRRTPPCVREMQERGGLPFRFLRKMVCPPGSTTPSQLNDRINGG